MPGSHIYESSDDHDRPVSTGRRIKPWIIWSVIAACVIALILSSPVLIMQWRLRDVPAIADPVDLTTGGRIDVPDEDNAFVKYRMATFAIVKPATIHGTTEAQSTDDNMDETLEKGWASASEPLAKWVDANQPALDVWREGTNRANALDVQPADLSFFTTLDVVQELRTMARLAELKALRLQHEGNLAEAWDWHRATLRSSQHLTMNGVMISRLVGQAVYSMGTDGIDHWAADPRVTAEQLDQALADLKEIDAMTAPFSQAISLEYRMLMSTIDTMNPQVAQDLGLPMQVSHPAFLEISGERELARRSLRLVFANYLSQCDLPLYARTPVSPGSLNLREIDPSAPPNPGLHPPAVVENAFNKSVLAMKLLPGIPQMMNANEPLHDAKRLTTRVTLAAQKYQREHGEFPESLDQLVGHGLDEVPKDPFGKGEPLRYRRDADGNATVWSVDRDGVDQNGVFDDEGDFNHDPHDIGRRLIQPATP